MVLLFGCVEDDDGAVAVDAADAGVEEGVTFLGADHGCGVEDREGEVGDGGGPGFGEGGFDGGDGGDVCLDKVAGGGLGEHVVSGDGGEVEDADAGGGLASLEELEDDVTTHKAWVRLLALVCDILRFFFFFGELTRAADDYVSSLLSGGHMFEKVDGVFLDIFIGFLHLLFCPALG